uniref:SNTX thioredoxin-like domain-containing protein n=1 Tax=Neogobius melanostomus TaxID=47308 RepID=A0A8C6TXQ3_9GOBI
MSKNTQMIVGGLGRPFTLGMLYNAPKDELIPGLSVLDSQTLQSLTVKQPQRSSHFDISASDSTKDSSFNLNVDASLKLSFMSGLIEVGGSANYLNNKKESKNQCRVTLQYQATTHFEQLSLTAEVCEKIKSSEIIEKGLATHVVTGIEYGANAFFVFDSQKVESSNIQTVKGQMEVTIKKIPTVEISGEAKFYGDFLLEKNPATFEAAVQTYVDLPKLLMGADGKEAVKTVPLKVWLLPLEVFTLTPAPVTKGISVGLVLEAEDTLEELNSITMRCNDCLSVSAVGKFPQLQQPLHKFYKLCNYYSVELQRQMAETCPAIREGTVSESVLRALFEERHTFPFSQDKLTQWLQDKERELNVVQVCLDLMEGLPVMSTQADIDKFVLAPGGEKRWGFTFTSLETTDSQLEEMVQYLKALKTGKSYEPKELQSAADPWFYNDEVVKKMRETAEYYKSASSGNTIFVTAINNTSFTGYAIYHYINGVKIDQWKLKDKLTKEPSIFTADRRFTSSESSLFWSKRNLNVLITDIKSNENYIYLWVHDLYLARNNKQLTVRLSFQQDSLNNMFKILPACPLAWFPSTENSSFSKIKNKRMCYFYVIKVH